MNDAVDYLTVQHYVPSWLSWPARVVDLFNPFTTLQDILQFQLFLEDLGVNTSPVQNELVPLYMGP